MVSTATRLPGSCASIASSTVSLIWSQILSGWPSVTDSDVNKRKDTLELLREKTPGSVCESTQPRRGGGVRAPSHQLGEHVRIADQLDGRRLRLAGVVGLLDLGVGVARRPEVGH